MELFLLLFGLFAFIGLVVVHEWGHFITAKRSGVEVEEFGIGFPPKAATITKKNGTEYTLNWLPLGGFVRLKGEHDDDERSGSFGAAKLKDKVKIMVAGVAMNLVTAYLLLIVVALIGMPQIVKNQFVVASDSQVTKQKLYIGAVVPESPADVAGLQTKDELITIQTDEGEVIRPSNVENLLETTKRLNGQSVQVGYQRGEVDATTTMQLLSTQEVEGSKNTDNPKGYMGIVPTEYSEKRSTWSAPIVAGGVIKQFTELTFKGLGSALAGLFSGNTAKATEQVSGPVGIYVVLKDGTIFGFAFILMVIAIISLTLAIMNALPIPALDGGRLFVTLLYRALGKKLTAKAEDRIHGTGMAVLLTLFVLITIVDVRRFF